MPAPIVVVNSTPLISLGKIKQLDILRVLFGKVMIPRAVYAEVHAKDDLAPLAVDEAAKTWLLVEEAPDPPGVVLRDTRLHAGEIEAIALAKAIGADYLLIDDNTAKHVARNVGIPVMGTLGMILMALREGIVDDIEPLLSDLSDAGFFASGTLLQQVRDAAKRYM